MLVLIILNACINSMLVLIILNACINSMLVLIKGLYYIKGLY